MNLLEVPVSWFPSMKATEPQGTLTLWQVATCPDYRLLIERIRGEKNDQVQKSLKSRLPAITPVAVLRHRKNGYPPEEKIIEQWPLLSLDIDQKDNPHRPMEQLKRLFSQLPYVVLCMYTVRKGLWVVIRLPEPQTVQSLPDAFTYVEKQLSGKYGIKLDRSKGKNPTDLRFMSYDEEPYLNGQAETLQVPTEAFRPAYQLEPYGLQGIGEDEERVKALLEHVTTHRLDLTQNYADWIGIGLSLAGTFGQQGRQAFHGFSQFNSRYSRKECEAKYDEFLHKQDLRSGLGGLINVCNACGIRVSDLNQHSKGPQRMDRLIRKIISS